MKYRARLITTNKTIWHERGHPPIASVTISEKGVYLNGIAWKFTIPFDHIVEVRAVDGSMVDIDLKPIKDKTLLPVSNPNKVSIVVWDNRKLLSELANYGITHLPQQTFPGFFRSYRCTFVIDAVSTIIMLTVSVVVVLAFAYHYTVSL